MTINLQRYCANELDLRTQLHKPWKVGKWAYATNGHFVLRVPAETQPDAPEATDKHPDVGAMFDNHMGRDGMEYLRIPTIPALTACFSCHSKGMVRCIKCPDCEDGEFQHGDHFYTCRNCDQSPAGAGWQWLDEDMQDQPHQIMRVCTDCDGLGFSTRTNSGTKLGDAHYSNVYLAMFAALPEARVCPGEPAGDYGSRPAPAVFIFDGGHGLLMPWKDA